MLMPRKLNDNYPSEPSMVAKLMSRITIQRTAHNFFTVLEPAAGAGQIAGPLRAAGLHVTTNDIDLAYPCNYYMDATTPAFWREVPRHDWVITNPPFNQLDDILEQALAHSLIGVAMILRLSALEPASKRVRRGEILKTYEDNMRFVMPFSSPRPSFTSDGKTDSVTTAWFVWHHGWSWSSYGMMSPFQFITDWKVK